MNLSQWFDSLARSFAEIAGQVQLYLPSVLGALALILLGWILAWVLRTWVVRLARLVERRFEGRVLHSAAARLGVDRTASDVVGAFVFWAILIVFLGAATEALGLPVLATWFGGLSQFLPRLLLATFIIMAGVLAGALARDAIWAAMRASGVGFDRLLGRIAQGAIIVAATITAVDQIGVDSRFLTGATMIALAAILGGCALAFGLGARTAASNIIAVHYVKQSYRTGQRVKVENVQGTIQQITTTAVLVDTPDGRVLIPGQAFAEKASTLVGEE
jgi:small-conductance mechanosensitive channel